MRAMIQFLKDLKDCLSKKGGAWYIHQINRVVLPIVSMLFFSIWAIKGFFSVIEKDLSHSIFYLVLMLTFSLGYQFCWSLWLAPYFRNILGHQRAVESFILERSEQGFTLKDIANELFKQGFKLEDIADGLLYPERPAAAAAAAAAGAKRNQDGTAQDKRSKAIEYARGVIIGSNMVQKRRSPSINSFVNMTNEHMWIPIGLAAVSVYFSWRFWQFSSIMAFLVGNYMFSMRPFSQIINSGKYDEENNNPETDKAKCIPPHIRRKCMAESSFLYAFLGNDEAGLIQLLQNPNERTNIVRELEKMYGEVSVPVPQFWDNLQKSNVKLKDRDINLAFKSLNRHLRRTVHQMYARVKKSDVLDLDMFCGGMTVQEYFAYYIGLTNVDHYCHGLLSNVKGDIDISMEDEFKVGDKVVLLSQSKKIKNEDDGDKDKPKENEIKLKIKYDEIIGEIIKVHDKYDGKDDEEENEMEQKRYEIKYEIENEENKKVPRKDVFFSHEFDLFYPWSCKPLKNGFDELEMQICARLFKVNIEIWPESSLRLYSNVEPELQFIDNANEKTIRLVSYRKSVIKTLDKPEPVGAATEAESQHMHKQQEIDYFKHYVSLRPSIGEFPPFSNRDNKGREKKEYQHIHPFMVFENGNVEDVKTKDEKEKLKEKIKTGKNIVLSRLCNALQKVYYYDENREEIFECLANDIEIKVKEVHKGLKMAKYIGQFMKNTQTSLEIPPQKKLSSHYFWRKYPDAQFFEIPVKIDKLIKKSTTVPLLASIAPAKSDGLIDALWAGLLLNLHLLQDNATFLNIFQDIFSNFRQDTEVYFQRVSKQEKEKNMSKVRQLINLYFGENTLDFNFFIDVKVEDIGNRYEDLKNKLIEDICDSGGHSSDYKLMKFMCSKKRYGLFLDECKDDDTDKLKKFRKYYGFAFYFFDRDIEDCMINNLRDSDEESALALARKQYIEDCMISNPLRDSDEPIERSVLPTIYLERIETLDKGDKVDFIYGDFSEAKIDRIYEMGYDIIYRDNFREVEEKINAADAAAAAAVRKADEDKYFRETVHPGSLTGFAELTRYTLIKGTQVRRDLSNHLLGTIVEVYKNLNNTRTYCDIKIHPPPTNVENIKSARQKPNLITLDVDRFPKGKEIATNWNEFLTNYDRIRELENKQTTDDAVSDYAEILRCKEFVEKNGKITIPDKETHRVAEIRDIIKCPVYDIVYSINNNKVLQTVHGDMIRSVNRDEILSVGDKVIAAHRFNGKWREAEIVEKDSDKNKYKIKFGGSSEEVSVDPSHNYKLRSKKKKYKYSCIQILGDIKKYFDYERNLEECRKIKRN